MFSFFKKSRTNSRTKREKLEYVLENSNKSTDENTHQGQLYVNLLLRLQNGQLCFDFLAPESIVGQEL